MRLNKKNIVVLLISVSILLSMSSCNYRGRASGLLESEDSVAAEDVHEADGKSRSAPGPSYPAPQSSAAPYPPRNHAEQNGAHPQR